MRASDLFREQQNEEYAGILKSEKASFLLIRKYCDEIKLQLSLLEENFAEPMQEVVIAQKATAKVTINRNKENAYALMNSNDRMQEQIASIENRIEKLSSSLASHGGTGDYSIDLSPILDKLQEMEHELKSGMNQTSNQIPGEMGQTVSESQTSGEVLESLGDLPDFTPVDVADVQPEILAEPELVAEPEPVEEPEPIVDSEPMAEPELAAEPEPIDELELAVDPEPADELEGALDPETTLDTEDLPEAELIDELDAAAESTLAEDFDSVPEPEITLDTEDLQESELLDELDIPSEPEQSDNLGVLPEVTDPNRAMSADEIAALFANIG
jgi:hypothetical protein